MGKLKSRVAKEIIATILIFVVLWALWAFVIREYVVLSDQGFTTIGLALSTSLGVLTAIVVSFVLITWQWSRQERSTSFWRWINALRQLTDSFDAKVEVLLELSKEIMQFTAEASGVSLVSPMPRERFIELTVKILNKANRLLNKINGLKMPSAEEVAKGRACSDITHYIILLTTANFEHRLSHDAYQRILKLRGLLYQLLVVLTASILVVAIAVTTVSKVIPDVFNAPLATVLLGWFVCVLIRLGTEIRGITRLEEQFRREGPPMEEIFKKYGILPEAGKPPNLFK